MGGGGPTGRMPVLDWRREMASSVDGRVFAQGCGANRGSAQQRRDLEDPGHKGMLPSVSAEHGYSVALEAFTGAGHYAARQGRIAKQAEYCEAPINGAS